MSYLLTLAAPYFVECQCSMKKQNNKENKKKFELERLLVFAFVVSLVSACLNKGWMSIGDINLGFARFPLITYTAS